MSLADCFGSERFALSFELFPPKTAAGETALFQHVERLRQFRPSFITCTYGAGGSTQSKTLDVVARVRRETGLPVATHLTCVNRTAEQLAEYVRQALESQVDNVVALRGDPPQGENTFRSVEGGFRHANELVAFLREQFGSRIGIAVAGYPEKHVEAPSPEADLANLRRKVAAGADVVLTQLFYDNRDFFNFRERAREAGIMVPIVPGLLPVTNLAQVERITSLCGAKLPRAFVADLKAAGDDLDAQFQVGVEHATRQIQELVDAEVPGLHLYVLNKSEAASEVLQRVKLPQC
jgi:methylenetetrahydrofolate reductase (NADPH)